MTRDELQHAILWWFIQLFPTKLPTVLKSRTLKSLKLQQKKKEMAHGTNRRELLVLYKLFSRKWHRSSIRVCCSAASCLQTGKAFRNTANPSFYFESLDEGLASYHTATTLDWNSFTAGLNLSILSTFAALQEWNCVPPTFIFKK